MTYNIFCGLIKNFVPVNILKKGIYKNSIAKVAAMATEIFTTNCKRDKLQNLQPSDTVAF
ncbi:MAG: hypothetical protein EA361_06515 [Bacteroidetes bacterium]|nr:MAG: hypothetical protein EA361_06515 [Bacteroidota bacterium]